MDTSDEWIRTRTGIRERRISEGEGTSRMAAEAAKRALENAGIKAEELDMILLGTSTPDCCFPSGACEVQAEIGAVNAAAYDLSAACSGFIFALNTGVQFPGSRSVPHHSGDRSGLFKQNRGLERPQHLRTVRRWSRSGGGAGGRRRRQPVSHADGIRRAEGPSAGLHVPYRRQFPDGHEAAAGIYDHGRPGSVQIRGEESAGDHRAGDGGSRRFSGGRPLVHSAPGPITGSPNP